MGTHYSHLSTNDRHVIEVFCRLGARPAAIASFLGRHRCTVGREISKACAFKRTSAYSAHFGQLHAQQARRQAGLARRKLGANLNSPAWLQVRRGLAAGMSPQVIAGRLARSCWPAGSHLQHPSYVSRDDLLRHLRHASRHASG